MISFFGRRGVVSCMYEGQTDNVPGVIAMADPRLLDCGGQMKQQQQQSIRKLFRTPVAAASATSTTNVLLHQQIT